jgi:hypothetical protein
MCITMPPPAPSPAPTPTPVPAPPPSPAPGNPPGIPPNPVVIDLALSKAFATNGLWQTFNTILYNGGFGTTSGAYDTNRLEIVLRNVTNTAVNPTLNIFAAQLGMAFIPPDWPQTFSIQPMGQVTVIVYLTPNPRDATYAVTVDIGNTSPTLNLYFAP